MFSGRREDAASVGITDPFGGLPVPNATPKRAIDTRETWPRGAAALTRGASGREKAAGNCSMVINC